VSGYLPLPLPLPHSSLPPLLTDDSFLLTWQPRCILCVCAQGLGSGPKQEVLGRLLAEAGDGACAVFVEDRLLTLDKTMADSALRDKVLPVLAGWGYNTEEQRASAASSGYTVRAHTQPPNLRIQTGPGKRPGKRLTDALCVRRSLPFPALAPRPLRPLCPLLLFLHAGPGRIGRASERTGRGGCGAPA
jgi:hypothetical protein